MANPLFRHAVAPAQQPRKPKSPTPEVPPTPLPPGDPWLAAGSAAQCAPDAVSHFAVLCSAGMLSWARRIAVSALDPLMHLGSGLTSDVKLARVFPESYPPDLTISTDSLVTLVSVKELDISMLEAARQQHRAVAELRALAWASGYVFPSAKRDPRIPLHPCIVPFLGCDAFRGRLFLIEQVRVVAVVCLWLPCALACSPTNL